MKRVSIFFYVSNKHGVVKLGGAERRLGRIFDELGQEGFQTEILLKVKEKSKEIDNVYSRVLNNKSVVIKQFDNYRSLFNYMKKRKFDWICYTDSYKAMVPYLIFGVVLGSKRMMLNVTTYTSELIFNNKLQSTLFMLVVKLSNRMDMLYPVGYLKFKDFFPKKKITLTPVAFTNLELFTPKKKNKVITFLGSLTDIKNPDLLVESIQLIQNDLRKMGYKVLICGTGPLFDKLERKINLMKCQDLIKLTGNVSPENVLPETEVFISIQNYNNYPSQSLLEAITSGCYVIASDEGDTRKIVKEDFGVLCQLNSTSISTEILKYIHSEEKEKKKVLAAARDFALSNFLIKKSVDHYRNLFD